VFIDTFCDRILAYIEGESGWVCCKGARGERVSSVSLATLGPQPLPTYRSPGALQNGDLLVASVAAASRARIMCSLFGASCLLLGKRSRTRGPPRGP
jgi:hypothetical protein